jgi:hypothetical protein
VRCLPLLIATPTRFGFVYLLNYLAATLITALANLVSCLLALALAFSAALHNLLFKFPKIFMCTLAAERSGAKSESEFREAKVKCIQSQLLLLFYPSNAS